ncbi:glycine-rich domain-containing protein [Acetobacter sicerae]
MRGRLLSTIKITSSQNYTPSRWAKTLVVEMVGGGGSGAGAPAVNTGTNYVSCGSPGAAGAYAQFCIDLTTLPISEIPLTVGAAGVGAVGGSGSAGGSTSFGAYVTCGGGGYGMRFPLRPERLHGGAPQLAALSYQPRHQDSPSSVISKGRMDGPRLFSAGLVVPARVSAFLSQSPARHRL